MTDKQKLVEQIKAVRDTGKCNMFDVFCVQMIAAEMGLDDLLMYLGDHSNHGKYAAFILTGDPNRL